MVGVKMEIEYWIRAHDHPVRLESYPGQLEMERERLEFIERERLEFIEREQLEIERQRLEIEVPWRLNRELFRSSNPFDLLPRKIKRYQPSNPFAPPPLKIELPLEFGCQVCHSINQGATFYFCKFCTGFRVHKSCAGLPHQIRHPFHPPHFILTMLPTDKLSAVCSNCLNACGSTQLYYCDLCEYLLCSECALMPLATSGSEGQDWIRGLNHVHPLRYLRDQVSVCIVCKSSMSHQEDDLYGCYKCKYFLHKSCSYLPPQELHLPVHRCNRGTLIRDVVRGLDCGMCKIRNEGRYILAYQCQECSLSVCLKCAEVGWTSGKSFKYEDHDHLLCLIEDIKGTASHSQCDSYDEYCAQRIVTSSDEFRRTDSTMLWCYQCDFRVHLLCGPLPSTVKHELHIHSLVLVDSMREDDSGEYYCDICETERDPLIRLYCCQECKFYAHVHCLLPEILKLLGGDLKNVALKSVNQDLWNVPNSELQIEKLDSTLTLKDVINQLSGQEKGSILRYYKWEKTRSGDKKNNGSNKAFKVGEEEIDEILQLSHFTREAFYMLYSDLTNFFSNRRENKVKLKASELALKVVNVKGCMIPYSLAPVLNKLLHYHWVVSRGFEGRSLGFNSFVIFIICKVVKSMHTTVPKCITKSLLQEWAYHLRFAQHFSAIVDFAWSQLDELIHAFLGFQAERLREEIPKTLTERIAELQRKLDSIRGSSTESKYKKYYSNKFSEYKWKLNAFGGSFNYQNLNHLNQGSD